MFQPLHVNNMDNIVDGKMNIVYEDKLMIISGSSDTYLNVWQLKIDN